MSDLEMLQAGIYRKIGRQRKRTLRKRGERVWFSPELQHFVWEPDWHTWNPKTDLSSAHIAAKSCAR